MNNPPINDIDMIYEKLKEIERKINAIGTYLTDESTDPQEDNHD